MKRIRNHCVSFSGGHLGLRLSGQSAEMMIWGEETGRPKFWDRNALLLLLVQKKNNNNETDKQLT